MRQHQKLLPLAAIAALTVLAGCASRQPASTAVVVVPPAQQSTTVSQATPAAIRTGTVVSVVDMSTTSTSSGQRVGSSGGPTVSSASSAGQIVTVQFDDGQRQTFDLAGGGQMFRVNDRVTVNTAQSPAVIAR